MIPDSGDDTFDFTELGERLRSPSGREVASASLARLAQLKEGIAGRLAGGLSPGEYERHAAVSEALAAAEAVVIRISSLMTVVPGTTSGSSPENQGE